MLIMFDNYKEKIKHLKEQKRELEIMKDDITKELRQELNKTFVNEERVKNLAIEYSDVCKESQRVEKEINTLNFEVKAWINLNVNNIVLV